MSEIIYRVTSETLQAAVRQIPHEPSQHKLEVIAKSLIDRQGHWDLISDWWYPKASVIWRYPLQHSTGLTIKRLVELNRFVTNGVSTRSGEYKSVQPRSLSPETFYKRYLFVSLDGGAKKILKWVIANAIRLRVDQVFHDGNHRTALLLLYEILANHKILLQATPMTLYTILSNRSNLFEHGRNNWDIVETRMYQHCKSRLKLLSSVPTTNARALLFGNAVKTLDIDNSLFNQLADLWFATEPSRLAPERRRFARHFKKLNRGLYEQFYRLCVQGNWTGPKG